MRWLAIIGLAACAPGAPAAPSWVEDVQPILLANCARCHGRVPNFGAPATFRLDVPGDEMLPDGRTIRGARTMGQFVLARAVTLGDMPTEGPGLSSRAGEIIDTWVNTNRPIGVREDNALPQVTLLAPPVADEQAALIITVIDEDRDSVTGELRANDVPIAKLHDGRQVVAWDTGAVAAGQVTLSAVVDDSQGPRTVALGMMTVSHTLNNAAPTITLQAPFGDALFADRDAPEIRVLVTDPDPGDVVDVDIVAFRDGEEVAVGAFVALPIGNLIAWDTDTVSASPSWRLRITASDGTATRTLVSDPIIVSHETTTETWATIGPVITRVCAQCHPNVLTTGPDFRAYDMVYPFRGLMYRKAIQRGEMPPKSIDVIVEQPSRMTDDEKARFRSWLLAGAPP